MSKTKPISYTYCTTNGTKTTIIPGQDGVTQAFIDTLHDCNRLEYNNNQTETRRHTTINNGIEDGKWLAVEDTGLLAITADESAEDRLHRAISKLKPKQQELIRSIYFNGVSVNDYAELEGVDHSAISHRLKTVIKKLKKLL